MEVSSQTNTYQAINAYQQKRENPVTLPVEPKDPTYKSSEIYEASQGNLISDKEGKISLTPQGETNLNNAKADKATEVAAEEQAQKDALRGVAVDYTAAQSKKSQVEIYLSVATDGEVSFGDDKTPSIIESLRDVQKQNNAVEAYATYQVNQQNAKPAFA